MCRKFSGDISKWCTFAQWMCLFERNTTTRMWMWNCGCMCVVVFVSCKRHMARNQPTHQITYIHRNKGLVAMLQAHISLFWCIDVCILFLGVYWFVLSLCACFFACTLSPMYECVCLRERETRLNFHPFLPCFSLFLFQNVSTPATHTHTHQIKLYTQSEYTLVSYDWTMCRFENETLTTNDREKKKKTKCLAQHMSKIKNLYSRIAAHIHTISTIWLNYWGELVSKYPIYTGQFSIFKIYLVILIQI